MTITRAFTSISSLLQNIKPGRLYSRKLSAKPCLNKSGSHIHSKYSVGDVVHGFKVSQITDVPELQLTAVRLSHEITGADYLHIAKDDPNNVFSVGFRTTPMDSTGVPHILEHTVLCGSKKYPVRDPFFKMLNRSLSTFMNAMTGNDFTVYPFCSQNRTDYKNLMSVYLDAVFNPNLKELDFSQEGWRLEHADIKDRNSDLEFKGVVFNEMKGVFANYQNLFLQKLQNGVLPSHTYGVVSGGYPLDIPNLTWDALRDFHKHHYHPSNSKIYSYGNQELSEILEFVENNYLKFFTKIEPNTEVPEEPMWSKPQFDHIECGVDPLTPREAQNSVAMSYLLCDISDSYEVFLLQILSELLVGGPNAPFYKSLIEKQYGTSYIPGVGYSGDTRSTTFSIGLVGVEEKKTDDILGAIDATFNSVKKNGFPLERVEAILHSIELGLKHQSANFGLGVYMSMCSMWNLDCDPIKALQINDIINKFKTDLKENPTLFQEKIDKYFLKNKHKYTLTMAPKENYEDSIKEKEKELLKKRVSSLSDDEKEKIYNLGLTLAEQQNAKENLDCLPTLHIADIERKIQYTTLDQRKLLDIPVQVCVQPTNDVLYFQSILNIQNIPSELESYVPLLCVILSKMGAGDLNFREFDQKVESTTGGLGVGMLIEPNADNSLVERGIVLSSHCLPKNSKEMFQLWEKVINELNLDDMDRFSTLVKMVSSNAANGVTQSGHRYAMLSAGASVNGYGAIREKWSGLTYIQLLNQIAEMDDLSPVLEKLSQLATLLINKERMRVAINVTSEYSDSSLGDLRSFLSNIRGEYKYHTSYQDMDSSLSSEGSSTHHIFPFPVNYTSLSFPGVAYNHPDSGSLRVLGRLLFPYLHREIREKGGAYGGGASASPGGPFTFYSYRDPNNTASLSAFNGAIDWVLGAEFSEREVEEAKLGVMQSLDAPVSPGSRGLRFFRSRITDSMFESHRQSVLECSREQIISAARDHVKDASRKGACLIGPPCPEIDERVDWRTVNHG